MRASALNERSVLQVSMLSLLKTIVCIGAIVVLAQRSMIVSDLPLWLDETWSGMIATQPDWTSFWREVWLDCNPPLYYLLLTLWTSVAGDSNFALRLPSLLFAAAAALTAFRFAPKELGQVGKWTWSALILFWVHALTLSVDARGYALLLFLSVVACLLFERLHRRLTMPLAAAWLSICSLMFLTHYYAAALIAAQAVLLLIKHRLHVFKVWPIVIIGVPALAWFYFHAPRLADYSRPDVAWYDPLQVPNGVFYLLNVIGHPSPTFSLMVILTVFGGLALKSDSDQADNQSIKPADQNRDALIATAISGALGLAIAFTVGIIQASLTTRYLIPMVPPVLLGVVLIALLSKRRELVCVLLVCVYLSPSLNFPQVKKFADTRNVYGYEKGSDFIASHQPDHLVFLWDHPAAKILDQGSLGKIGGYFLSRSGLDVETSAIVVREDEDPNLALSRAANGRRPAFIWLFNKHRKSAARHYPSRFQHDPSWTCRSYIKTDPRGDLGAIACVKKVADNV